MSTREIKPNIYSVGALDAERRLFDELIPLPDGTSYNSYIIKGSDKVALLDTVDPPKAEVLLANLKELGLKKIDYIVAHHAEQDHSGTIPKVLEKYPEAKVVTNARCKEMLKDLLLIPDDKFIVVADREKISLGDKTLEFILTPWVHWPETMVTYLKEDKILFSCDFFGSHLASSDLFVADEAKVYDSAKRYYAEIMMPFRSMIKKHLEIVDKLVIDVIATSHGPIYDKPSFIIDAYRDWITDEVKNEVVIPYVSMHGSTQAMVDYFIDALEKKGITVKPFNLTKTDLGELAMALVDAATIVIGSPTVLVGAHPAAVNVAFLANALRPKAKFLSIIGSYGWGGKMVDQLKGLIPVLKVELLDPVVIKGFPKEEDLRKLDGLAEAIAQKHREDILVRKG
ncbi:MBL fold hydrolase [candidate division WOR-1 bacterium RIFOXYB2_FULL_42_35]|uniref:MBL fold hydrolase n=1 Tax=candidate division WOR-1 bacterium RIFOXYC2_FULL_41_25 TaxID=1802586 RepID=A0A1F4TJ40_UNCSA|nr:MAG: MBL fold hydrolase [candidate division WOR-1 bacterium RIFOXYA2_FULL_41_14]OGC21878.1 MAG: MBL fold hydrolase [candidate division WOR-1 bacterium RIFOXYB2_FULL_42_35]OGC32742.1 MAG: MBL fold hydrolase [candidate division WOR-1 bacterium RIFOXYC2_FULL_41_25]OGC42538.1 MAG: MBL fold hydrolase [candidate division WOR-1 bacterium RIFOXYD2_FULL_41_8]